MFKYYFSYLLFIPWRHPIRVGLLNIKILFIYPILAFHISFPTMHMNGLISFICIKEKSPP